MWKIIKRLIEQTKFWIEWSRWLRCKHCCINCRYYDQCVCEVDNFEDKLYIDKFWD